MWPWNFRNFGNGVIFPWCGCYPYRSYVLRFYQNYHCRVDITDTFSVVDTGSWQRSNLLKSLMLSLVLFCGMVPRKNSSSCWMTLEVRANSRLYMPGFCRLYILGTPPTPPYPPTTRTLVFGLARNVINLCSLLIYTPSSVRHHPPRNRCVFSCKMRLGFISTVNLHVTPADRGGNRCVFSCKMRLRFISTVNLLFNEKCALYQPPQIPCVFSGNMRLAFLVIVNSCKFI